MEPVATAGSGPMVLENEGSMGRPGDCGRCAGELAPAGDTTVPSEAARVELGIMSGGTIETESPPWWSLQAAKASPPAQMAGELLPPG